MEKESRVMVRELERSKQACIIKAMSIKMNTSRNTQSVSQSVSRPMNQFTAEEC